jgi:Fe2+ transport system protein B
MAKFLKNQKKKIGNLKVMELVWFLMCFARVPIILLKISKFGPKNSEFLIFFEKCKKTVKK